MKFIKVTFFSGTIWLSTAVINSLLFTVFFSGNLVRESLSELFGLSMIFSLLFSVPAAFLFWLVFMIKAGIARLSLLLLRTAFVLALLSCPMILLLPNDVYGGQWLLLALFLILSPMAAVLLHHRVINRINTEYHV